MNMRRLIMSVILVLCCASLNAQSFENYRKAYLEQHKQYKQTITDNYNSYRDSLNQQFADFMRKSWVEKSFNTPIPVPVEPKPTTPIVLQPEEEEPSEVVEDVVTITDTPIINQPFDGVETPIDSKPLVQIPSQERYDFCFNYYGTEISLPLGTPHQFRLGGVDENSVADAWLILSGDDYIPLLEQAMLLRQDLQMSDWGYVRFVQKAAEAFFGDTNEAIVLQMYLLSNSGYKVRMARVNDHLILLLPSMAEIWQYSYITIGDYNYYMIDDKPVDRCYLLEYAFPNEQTISLEINREQLFGYEATDVRYLTCASNLIGLTANKNLLDFYADYPLNNTLTVYATSPLYSMTKYQLYPALRNAIEGLKQVEAANLLLNFVQTSFAYQTDQEQFGCEKPMFVDEMLFYPYCDCEDRSFLFARLVNDLLGLEVVLLDYPGHIATAVCFTDDVQGDYYQIGGNKYIVCDPTYINAPVGRSMPGLSSPEIVSLNM